MTCEPGRRAASIPRPISTALIAWTLITAAASRASSLRSHWAWLPSPIGHPVTTASTTPPRVSPASRAASIAATMDGSASGLSVYTGLASRTAGSNDSGGAAMPPSSRT